MIQLLQNLKTGQIRKEDIPVPYVEKGCLLIKSTKSLVSLGTERTLSEFARKGWIKKATAQPERVKQVLQKVKTDGFKPTIKAVRSKLDKPMPIGYCNSGVVVDMGDDVTEFSIGDRVVSNGNHAEVVLVPQNLCAKIPDAVDDTAASFTVLGAIGLQGIRLINPTLGESIAVIGLGLVGLISAQILKANGCRVIGFDYDQHKIDIARGYGLEAWNLLEIKDQVEAAMAFTGGRGIDAVLVTASTKSNEPISVAPKMCRKRGRIVLVGVTGLNLERSDFYEKEITFQVSCSYGPGRYEYEYEQKGLDYPLGYVRWTEQRNFEAILQLMAEKKIVVDKIVSRIIPFEEAEKHYTKMISDSKTLGVVFDYPDNVDTAKTTVVFSERGEKTAKTGKVKIGCIGAGNFTSSTLLPSFKKTEVVFSGIASSKGLSGFNLGKNYGFEFTTSDYRSILGNADINVVIITTPHNLHASMVMEAIKAKKHVFVEKPLAITREEMGEVISCAKKSPELHLMVGFNRRFSPHAEKIKSLLKSKQSPLTISMMVNAGAIPADHWVQDRNRGGGRIIGEGCHFIDLMVYLMGSRIDSVYASNVGASADGITEDKMIINLYFKDGSIGTIQYFANGHKDFPKERIEVFSDGRILVLDNFRNLSGYGFPSFKKMKLRSQDKGHDNEIRKFIDAVSNGLARVIPLDEIENVTSASFAAVESAQLNKIIHI